MADYGLVNILPVIAVIIPLALQMKKKRAETFSMISIVLCIGAIMVSLNSGFFRDPDGFTTFLVTIALGSVAIAVIKNHRKSGRGKSS